MNRLSCLNGFYLLLKILKLYILYDFSLFSFFFFSQKYFGEFQRKRVKKTAKILFCKKKKKDEKCKNDFAAKCSVFGFLKKRAVTNDFFFPFYFLCHFLI